MEKNIKKRDFPGGPVGKTPGSQCRGPGFDPWSGNKIPHAATKIQRSQIKIFLNKKSAYICITESLGCTVESNSIVSQLC